MTTQTSDFVGLTANDIRAAVAADPKRTKDALAVLATRVVHPTGAKPRHASVVLLAELLGQPNAPAEPGPDAYNAWRDAIVTLAKPIAGAAPARSAKPTKAAPAKAAKPARKTPAKGAGRAASPKAKGGNDEVVALLKALLVKLG
jgi:hypothetical protein